MTASPASRLIDLACERTGITEFDSDSFREGLGIASDALYRHPRRTERGRRLLEGLFVEMLACRLKIADYQHSHPQFRAQRIEKPVFILGMPRTGTTLVTQLLACDPAHRALLRWEIQPLMMDSAQLDPMPPATAASLHTDPRCQELKRIDEELATVTGDFRSIHYEAPDEPTECVWPLGHDFKSAMIEVLLASPEYSKWYLACDMGSAYQYHKRLLQTFNLGAPGTWALKAPSHALGVRQLLNTYPDARLVWCHRDPYKVTGSLLNLVFQSEMATVDKPDLTFLRCTYLEQLHQHVARLMSVQHESLSDPFEHVFYAQMMRDPIAQMRRLYGAFGTPLTPRAETRMRAWLKANPQGRFGRHQYGLDGFGLAQKDLVPYFEQYLDRFEIETES